jgi:outer membrane protein OmpA-like peptidoglycan-associated protein
MRNSTTGFIFPAVIWLAVIALGTVGSHYYSQWVVEDRKRADVEMKDLEDDFRKKWDEALDTCADTPSVDSYGSRVNLLYRGKLTDRLQRIDDTLKKKHVRIKLAFDSFSGYAVFRSREFQARLSDQDVRVHLIDDKADYKKRIQTLQSGETPLAVFTVDALINNSALCDTPPAAIVMVIDESQGADAIVSYKDAVPNIQALNRHNIKIVLTPDSPSETLARLVRFHYDLPDLPKECFIEAEDAQDVYARFKKASPGEATAFVLWEPYVSQLLQEYPQAHKLIDSSDAKCRGYIMDVLVVQKDFLEKNRKDVEAIVRAYLEASAAHQQAPDGMIKLVQADSAGLVQAGKLPRDLTYPEAEKVVKGIRWKRTKDNYAHFGLLSGSDAADTESLEDTIKKITTVLIKTKASSRSVKQSLVDKEVCANLQKENFDENKAGVLVANAGPFDPKKDWAKLQPVSGVKREPISFRRGSFDLSADSIDQLQEVANTMQSQSDYYLEIQGSAQGTTPADTDLAQRRAEVVFNWLRDKGLEEKRMKTRTASAAGDGTVTFGFLKPPR